MRPLGRAIDAVAMSCGWPPEQARLKRSEIPVRAATSIEALADRWQKKAFELAAVHPGKPWATPFTSTTGW